MSREDEGLLQEGDSWKIPLVIVLLAAASVLTVTFLIFLWLKIMLPRSKSDHPEWILHPVVKPPPLHTCDAQPSSSEPLAGRVKAKGLLERRGSSASLTIDLHPSQENLAVVTPTKECSTQEFLLSAGNCYSRKELRHCLRDPRALHSEFWDIPSNIPERTELAGSGTKNRYRSILPNEHTRVKLPEVEGDPLAGYINANYVRGYEGEERAYIATQGPLPHTLHDFWSMVISEKARAIVMITKLREKGRTKCEAYLPTSPGEPLRIDDVSVRVTHMHERSGYVLRNLHVKREDGQEMELRHFWFTDWPDHKAPDDAGPLVAMAREVSEDDQEGPVVVHCSAGIGRTGCFIALATGMRQLREQANVDILGIVCAMRHDRGGMVQTGEQYEFIHRALCLYERSLDQDF